MKSTRKLMSSMLVIAVLLSGCSSKTSIVKNSEEKVDIYSAEYAGAREEGTEKSKSGDIYYDSDYVYKYQFPKSDPDSIHEDSVSIANKLSSDALSLIMEEALSTNVSVTTINFVVDLIKQQAQDVKDYTIQSMYSLDTLFQVKVSNGNREYNVCGTLGKEDSKYVNILYTIQQYVQE